jgi:hypothetical protein
MRKRRFGLLDVSTCSVPCVGGAGGRTADGGIGGFGGFTGAQGAVETRPTRSVSPSGDSAILDKASLVTSLKPTKWCLNLCFDLDRDGRASGCAAAGGSLLSVDDSLLEAFVFLNMGNPMLL